MIYKTAYRDSMGNHRTRFDVGEVHSQTFFRASSRRQVPNIKAQVTTPRAPRLVPRVFRVVALGEFKAKHKLS